MCPYLAIIQSGIISNVVTIGEIQEGRAILGKYAKLVRPVIPGIFTETIRLLRPTETTEARQTAAQRITYATTTAATSWRLAILLTTESAAIGMDAAGGRLSV
jgi:hypothetical protein